MADTTAETVKVEENNHVTSSVSKSGQAAPEKLEDGNGLKELATPDGDAKESVRGNDAETKVTNDATKPAAQAGGSRIGRFLKANFPIFLMMAKAALPPTIVLAMYQSNSIASILGSLGYLSAIISILSMAILPRAKFFTGIWVAVLCSALAIACGLFTAFCAVKAREHTSKPIQIPKSSSGAQTASLINVPYNSSAAAVSAVWLFFWTFFGNLIRILAPPGNTGVILFSVLIVVVCCNAPLFPNMTVALSFVKSLLKAVYLGLGIGAGVSLVVIPISVKSLYMKQFTEFLMSLRGCLEAYRILIHTLGSEESISDALLAEGKLPAVKELSEAAEAVSTLNAKLQTDLPFAKREVGLSKFGPSELKNLNDYTRFILIPTIGLSGIVEILQHFASARGFESSVKLDDGQQALRDKAIKEWAFNMRLIKSPIDTMVDILVEGIDHVMIVLGLKPRSKQAADIEASAAEAAGDPGFAARLVRVSEDFYSNKHLTLIEWSKARGLELPKDFFENPATAPVLVPDELKNETVAQHQANQRQIYLLLFMEYLLYNASQSLLKMVQYVDDLAASGKLKRVRLIVPEIKQIRKLFTHAFHNDDLSHATEHSIQDVSDGNTVFLGASYRKEHDPEHLAPANAWEHFGDHLRKIGTFFRSPNAAFCLRCAFATISITLPVFLKQTYKWSAQYRVFWAAIMATISMTPTSGQSVFGFVLKIVGTTFAMFLSWCIWYIPDNGKIPGVIVLFWFFTALCWYIPLKHPQFAQVGIITIVTIALTIGYELEGKKIGEAALASSGAVYLSILKFGPVRLATVLAGLTSAFFWTIFPYPISEHNVLRKDLGSSLYLLASFYSVVHETVTSRVRGDQGDPSDKNSPAYKLEKTRIKLFNKQQLVLNSLRTNLRFSKFEIRIGGKFPKDQYEIITECISRITNYMTMVSFASRTFAETSNDTDGSMTQWSADFRRLTGQIDPTSHETVMLLSLVSGAVVDGRALPPYLPRPAAYSISQRLELLDPTILSVRHVNERGYAAFAVMQLAARCIGSDLDKMIIAIRKVVGTMDFSYRIDRSGDVSEDGEALLGKTETEVEEGDDPNRRASFSVAGER